jgi:hypothetical protein
MQHIIPFGPTLNSVKLELIEQTIDEHFARRLEADLAAGIVPRRADREKMKTQMLDFVIHVIAPQMTDGFRLFLDADRIEEAGFSARRGKQLYLELKAAGVIFFPEWSRQKGPGQVPFWMLVTTFIDFQNVERKAKTPKTSKTYNQKYCDLYEEACKMAYAALVEYRAQVTIQTFMCNVYSELNGLLRTLGIDKADLVK